MAERPIVLIDEVIAPPALVRAGMGALPASILSCGERAGRRLVEFFTANIRSRNARMAYAQAVKRFFDCCEARRLGLDDIEPMTAAACIEQLGARMTEPTVRQHLAAIRQLFDYVVGRAKAPMLSSDGRTSYSARLT